MFLYIVIFRKYTETRSLFRRMSHYSSSTNSILFLWQYIRASHASFMSSRIQVLFSNFHFIYIRCRCISVLIFYWVRTFVEYKFHDKFVYYLCIYLINLSYMKSNCFYNRKRVFYITFFSLILDK